MVRQRNWRQRVSTTSGKHVPENITNDGRHTLIPPRGYTIGGISGSCAQWLDGFALIITR